jgi:hypothetical protein
VLACFARQSLCSSASLVRIWSRCSNLRDDATPFGPSSLASCVPTEALLALFNSAAGMSQGRDEDWGAEESQHATSMRRRMGIGISGLPDKAGFERLPIIYCGRRRLRSWRRSVFSCYIARWFWHRGSRTGHKAPCFCRHLGGRSAHCTPKRWLPCGSATQARLVQLHLDVRAGLSHHIWLL